MYMQLHLLGAKSNEARDCGGSSIRRRSADIGRSRPYLSTEHIPDALLEMLGSVFTGSMFIKPASSAWVRLAQFLMTCPSMIMLI
jgi:hypothetical protein